MGVSIIDVQREIIIETIRSITRGDWKVLIVDEESRKIIDNVVKEDDILNQNITNIERIEDRRPDQKETDAVYFLTPKQHIVDCILADFERRKYRGTFLIWTSHIRSAQRERIDRSQNARQQIRDFRIMHLDYTPRESHLITFKDPWSFPTLFHPDCNGLVAQHLEDLAERITGVCIGLGEYPAIRYYRPRNPSHEASVLCSHLARMAQDKLDRYAQQHQDYPPPSNRPQAALYITDRSMDLYAPFLHEFTYQAMAHDLLPIKEGDKVTYKTVVDDEPGAEEKDMEINEKDTIWVENRHRHMKDTIDKIMGDFQKFIADNPHFTKQDSKNATGVNGLNAIKDMIAGLPQFQEMKDAYSLHLSMAQECMNIFQRNKLPDLASVEQCLATALDEDYRKPKNMADQVVRTLDDEDITPSDRLRLIALYVLYKDGILPSDMEKLLFHSQLPPTDGEVIRNLTLLGGRIAKGLKEKREPPPPIFPRKTVPPPNAEEYALSRFTPAVQDMLEEHVRGTLPQDIFPYVKPPADDGSSAHDNVSAASLRSAKPTWAKSRLTSVEPRQRVMVFMAGGATYSEARACYEVSQKTSRDVFLVSSHMMTPTLYLRQLGDLSVNRRQLRLPADAPPPQAPAHLFEKPEPPKPAPPPAGAKPMPNIPGGLPSRPGGSGAHAPPTQGLQNMTLNSGRPQASAGQGSHFQQSGKPGKDYEKEKKKKKHHFFSSK